MLTALFAGGHILLEGPPGTAKTFLAQCFARTVNLEFGRIQFTPDLMPGDILGANLFNFQASAFTLVKGPIFCELLLADEINRTPPKTQAALLEAMQERTVTLDGESHPLSDAVHRGGDPEPDRAAGHLSPAGGPARPLPVQAAARLSHAEEERRIVASHGARAGQPERRPTSAWRRRRRRPRSPRRSPRWAPACGSPTR